MLRWAQETKTAVVSVRRRLGRVGRRRGGRRRDRARHPQDGSHARGRSRTALTVTAQTGIMGRALEEHLAGHGLTLGHFPQSIDISTLGGWIAARSAGQKSARYGRLEDMILGLEVVLPGRRSRAHAAGPGDGRRTRPRTAVRRERGHARRRHGGDARGPPRAERRQLTARTRSIRSPPASTPSGASRARSFVPP